MAYALNGGTTYPSGDTIAASEPRDDSSESRDYATRLESVFVAVEERFYRDPTTLPNYFAAKQSARTAVETCDDHLQFGAIVNRYLQILDASHTYYLTPYDWEYYQIAGVFESLPIIQELFHHQPLTYPSIGVIAHRLEQGWMVADVLPGSAAAESGLRIGDVLLKVNEDEYSPVVVWWPLVGEPATLSIRRQGQPISLPITARKVHPSDELLAALEASISVVEHHGTKIGYAHFYSYAGKRYQEALEQAIQAGKLAQAQALVIDLRYGLGGADANYLNLFNRDVPELESIDRNGDMTKYSIPWRKPVVMLINETSRSGKEVLAFGAKQHGLATLVGTKTAGAVLAGSPIVIDGEDLLYLAVRDVRVDGQRLEKNGVAPHVEVTLDLSRCNGIDQQREAAFDEAAKLVKPTIHPSRPSS
jgi:carboxyl-terminal processing protease